MTNVVFVGEHGMSGELNMETISFPNGTCNVWSCRSPISTTLRRPCRTSGFKVTAIPPRCRRVWADGCREMLMTSAHDAARRTVMTALAALPLGGTAAAKARAGSVRPAQCAAHGHWRPTSPGRATRVEKVSKDQCGQ